MIKYVIKILVLVAILGVAAFGAYKLGLFGNSELKIDKTANVVEDIKRIGEFYSTCYYEGLVIKDFKSSEFNKSYIGDLFNTDFKDEIVIIANGKVKAGFNLAELDSNDLVVNEDSISITLPKAVVFDVILNPTDYEIYVENGTWSHEKVVKLTEKAKDRILQDALNFGILEKAEKTGMLKLGNLFKSMGFNYVYICIDSITAPF